jgi:hypothetical protein
MSKLIFWIVVVFVALFALRLVNVGKAKRRARDADEGKRAGKPDESMVRCSQCGVFLPQGDARPVAGGYLCGDPACAARR